MKPKKISEEAFKRYGHIIGWNGCQKKDSGNLFRIVIRDRHAAGWRIAYLIVRERKIRVLEQHPDSLESFEPVRGKSLLYVAAGRNPRRIECFSLDKPVVLKKGVWHGVVTLGREAHIKITENNRVGMRKKRCKGLSKKPVTSNQ